MGWNKMLRLVLLTAMTVLMVLPYPLLAGSAEPSSGSTVAPSTAERQAAPVWSAHDRQKAGQGTPVPASSISLDQVPTAGQSRNAEWPQVHVQGGQPPTGPLLWSEPPPSEIELIGVPTKRPESVRQSVVGDLVEGFAGMNSSFKPADTILAVGPDHVIEAVNLGFTVWTKDGTKVRSDTTFSDFFHILKPVGWQGYFFDPRVVYSVQHRRFLLLTLGKDGNHHTSHVFLAISKSADATGAWWMWRIDQTFGNPDDSDAWYDYASLGIDSWGIYVVANMFYWTNTRKHTKLLSLSRGMLNGGSANGWAFWDLHWPAAGDAISLQVAQPFSIADRGETFFVNSHPEGGNQILLWSLSGNRTSSPSLSKVAISTSLYSPIGTNVGQPGATLDLDGGDARVLNAVYSRQKVYATLTTDPWHNEQAAGFFVVKLDVESSTKEWDVVGRSAAGAFYFYPAMTICGGWSSDPELAVYMSWTWPTESQYASGAVKIFTEQPPSNVTPPINVVSGLGAFQNPIPDGNRWGDYNGAVFDWYTGNVWGAVMYANFTNWWDTWIEARVFCEVGGAIPFFANGFESGDTVPWSVTVE